LTPQLRASSIDKDGGNLAYTWQVRDPETAIVVATGTSSAAQSTPATWTVPAGKLVNHTVYEFRVAASDGVASPVWSGWSNMGIEANDAPQTPTNIGLSPCADPCDALVSTSAIPMLTAAVEDANDFVVDAQFEVREAGSTALVASGDGASYEGGAATYAVPQGALANGHRYEFRVGGSDSKATTWSAWTPFTVAVPGGPLEPVALGLVSCDGPCGDWTSNTTMPTFSASRPVDTGVADLTFEVRSSAGFVTSGTAPGVSSGGSGTWTVPAGVLESGSFDVRAGAQRPDGTTWTRWTPFGVAATAEDGASFPAAENAVVDPEGTYYDASAQPSPALDA
jgi:hypothetical protein